MCESIKCFSGRDNSLVLTLLFFTVCKRKGSYPAPCPTARLRRGAASRICFCPESASVAEGLLLLNPCSSLVLQPSLILAPRMEFPNQERRAASK